MRICVSLVVFLFIALPAVVAAAATEKESFQDLRTEVVARKLVREHESGRKKATEGELAAARLVILKASEKRARVVAGAPNGDFLIDLKSADMMTVAKIWKEVFGFEVSVEDRLRGKKVTLSVGDPSLEQFRTKLSEALERSGVYLVWRKDGTTALDSVPDKVSRR